MSGDFYFTQSSQVNFNDLIAKLLDMLVQSGYIDSQLFNKLQLKELQYDKVLRALFVNLGESFVKQYLHDHFEINFTQTISCAEILDDEIVDLLLCTHTIVEKIENNILYIIVDYPCKRTHDKLLTHFKVDKIIHNLALKQDIVNSLSSVYGQKLSAYAIDYIDKESAKHIKPEQSRSWMLTIFLLMIFTVISGFNLNVCLIILIICNIVYFCSWGFKFFLSIVNLNTDPILNSNISIDVIEHPPIYSILLPCYKECKSTFVQLVNSMQNLKYPPYQLDAHILLEEDDFDSISAIKSINLSYIFNIIYIPGKGPRTKAKACNYALKFIRGEYVVIYDADDIPCKNQLNDVLKEFTIDDQLACVQCVLNNYNKYDNILTKFYSIEFSMWYQVFLPALKAIKAPLTFGGTSNHFKSVILKDNPYDAFNVTEDAELGIRWWSKNFKIKLISSLTLEESPISIKNWIRQRSRWIKGFVQTYVSQYSNKVFAQWKLTRCLKFATWLNLFIIVPILAQSLFLVGIFESIIFYFVFESKSLYLLYISIANLIIGYGAQIFSVLINGHNISPKQYIILFPIYSILNIIATYKGLYQFSTKQYYWEKTSHGLGQV